MVETTMDVSGWLRKQLEEASPDLLRVMVKDFAEALMSADADAVCGAGYGERTPERVNRRNGYRERLWETRSGTVPLKIQKLPRGSSGSLHEASSGKPNLRRLPAPRHRDTGANGAHAPKHWLLRMSLHRTGAAG